MVPYESIKSQSFPSNFMLITVAPNLPLGIAMVDWELEVENKRDLPRILSPLTSVTIWSI